MTKQTNQRIVTFMAYPELVKSAKVLLLLQGNSTITLGEKQRYFTARTVTYQEATPLYATPTLNEVRYTSIQDLLKDHPSLFDSPILDNDNYLKVWNK